MIKNSCLDCCFADFEDSYFEDPYFGLCRWGSKSLNLPAWIRVGSGRNDEVVKRIANGDNALNEKIRTFAPYINCPTWEIKT